MVGAKIILFRAEKPEDFIFLAVQLCFLGVPGMGFQNDRGFRRKKEDAKLDESVALNYVDLMIGSYHCGARKE
jgi:hypothetical protein